MESILLEEQGVFHPKCVASRERLGSIWEKLMGINEGCGASGRHTWVGLGGALGGLVLLAVDRSWITLLRPSKARRQLSGETPNRGRLAWSLENIGP